MRSVIFSPLAEIDLLEIWNYIAADSVRVAARVTAEIEEEVADLAVMPGKGHTREDVNDPTCRCWTVYSYVIIYRFDDSTITIARILHGARDFTKLF